MYSEEILCTIENVDALAPDQKRGNWFISFGLQAVDGLKPSEYMRGLAEDNISGNKSYAQVAEAVETQTHVVDDMLDEIVNPEKAATSDALTDAVDADVEAVAAADIASGVVK
jgi:hypothetical protein